MEFNGKIADITIEPKTKRVVKLDFARAKLGGPKLLPKDIERLKQAGHSLDSFLEVKQASLKSNKDDSCIFLSHNIEKGIHECSVYDCRPTFCILYPLKFEKSGQQS